MIKHVFFDLDNTLMMSRSEMAAGHRQLFKQLCASKDVIVVSGAQESQIRTQIPDAVGGAFFVLGQTGNQAIDKARNTLWKESFSEAQTIATLTFIETLKREFGIVPRDPNDLVELRGAQISYSPIGHHELSEKKYAFDPSQEMRRRVIGEHAAEVARLNELGVDVVPAGTTCFDFFLAGHTKGFNIARLIEHMGWKQDECVYVGDALFPGGNDETVVGVIPTHAVTNPDDTFDFIKKELLDVVH